MVAFIQIHARDPFVGREGGVHFVEEGGFQTEDGFVWCGSAKRESVYVCLDFVVMDCVFEAFTYLCLTARNVQTWFFVLMHQ